MRREEVKTDFYVKPNGEAIPTTVSPEKYDFAKQARNALQIYKKWSDSKVRGEFDMLQAIDNVYVPTTKGNTTNIFEPLTNSYPQYGTEGHNGLE